MPCAAAGAPDASANIPIAPMIQIDAGIIVSLYLVPPLDWSMMTPFLPRCMLGLRIEGLGQ
jgi:hypothetical protein